MRVVLTQSISFEGSVFLCPLFSRNCYIYSRQMKGVCQFIWFLNRNISNADISIETYGGLSSFIVFTTQNLPKSKEYLYSRGELRTAVNTMTIDCTWRIRLNYNDRKHSSGSLDEPEYLEVWPDLTSLLWVVNTFLNRFIKCSRIWEGIWFASSLDFTKKPWLEFKWMKNKGR